MKKVLNSMPVKAGLVSALMATAAYAEGTVEVMHWWTSGGEANALSVIKEGLEADGINWKDSAVAGGSGTNALQVLQARVASGNPPAAMQMHGQQLLEYGSFDILGNLNELAAEANWDETMSPALQNYAKQDGVYVGVPINMHRHNWMWGSKEILDNYGGVMPTTWDEFFALADQMVADGVQPLAHGGQAWQEFMLWEDVVVGTGGTDFHKAALQDLDRDALTGATMQESFDTFRKVLGYADANAANRDWNLATAMVIEDQAAFQLMGDWAKGEFIVAGKEANTDYLCAPAPGTGGSYIFLADYWGFFPVADAGDAASQAKMAAQTMDAETQIAFNQRKGSIPARIDIDPSNFDTCGAAAINDRANGVMLPSLAQNHAQPREVRGVFEDVITSFANDSSISSADAVARIIDGLNNL